jgi:hypothetical protein
MFERICVPPLRDGGKRFDLGLLAEGLLFYRDVVVQLHPSSVEGFFRDCPPDVLLELHAQGHLRIVYLDSLYATFTHSEARCPAQFDPCLISADKFDLECVARGALINVTGKTGRGRRLAERFLDIAEPVSYPEGTTECVRNDLRDGKYVESYISHVLQSRGLDRTDMSPRFRFGDHLDRGFTIDSNIDFQEMEARGVVELSDPSSILTTYGTAVANLALWSSLDAEAAVGPEECAVLTSRIDAMFNFRLNTDRTISAFQRFIFDDSRAVRDVINRGEKQLTDLVPVLERARKFKDWLQQDAPQEDLLKAYFREATAQSWIDRLPVRAARWVLFVAAELAAEAIGHPGLALAAGPALSAFDSLFLDRIAKGWKPHQFVEGELREFVAKGVSKDD